MNSQTLLHPQGADEASAPLLIPSEIHAAMLKHCQSESPLECCGLLGGVGRRVLSCHPLGNLARSETRYQGDPRDLIAAWRTLREQGWQILAIYHSHPRWEAVPSATDLRDNYWGDMTHVIVSLLGANPTVRAWRLSPSSYEELPWILVDSSGAETLRSAPAGG